MLFDTDVAASGVLIIMPTIDVTEIIGTLKQRVSVLLTFVKVIAKQLLRSTLLIFCQLFHSL